LIRNQFYPLLTSQVYKEPRNSLTTGHIVFFGWRRKQAGGRWLVTEPLPDRWM